MNEAYKLLVLVPNSAPHEYLIGKKEEKRKFRPTDSKIKKSWLEGNTITFLFGLMVPLACPCFSNITIVIYLFGLCTWSWPLSPIGNVEIFTAFIFVVFLWLPSFDVFCVLNVAIIRLNLLNVYLLKKLKIVNRPTQAWKKCGIWESHSREVVLLEGNICNFEGEYDI